MNEVLYQQVSEIIAEQMGVDATTLTPEKRLKEDLGADSIEMVELIMAFETEFGQSMPDEDMANIQTIQDIVTFIEKQQNAS